MATPPSSRGSSLDCTFLPATLDPKPIFNRSTTSMSVPRSEYLRHALQARRAQNTPVQSTPAPIDTLPPRPAASTPLALQTPATSPDAFDEYDLPEELMTPESPIHRRRPNEKDNTPPRGKTNLELSAEVEKLKDELIKQNIRVELLKKNNHELQNKWVQAKEETELLSVLREENRELAEENKLLAEKLEGLKEYEDQLDDLSSEVDTLWYERKEVEQANATLREEVLNLARVNNEAVANMQDQQGAFEEAVEMITNLESEKLHLKEEVSNLKKRVIAIESRQLDGSAKYPQRVCSIDEGRPTTSYDDSDYYSQPATPRADVDRDALSVRSGTSVQSKRFIEMSKERTRSARNLSKRMSDASLRATSVMSTVQLPEVPYLPQEFARVTPQLVDERFRERRYRQGPGVEQHVARSGADLRRPATVAPVQIHQPSGLRSLYRPDPLQRSNTSRPSSSHTPTASSSPEPRSRTQSLVDPFPAPPPRMSSRHAHTTSDDYLRLQASGSMLGAATMTGIVMESGAQDEEQEQVLTTWTSIHPRSSTKSLLTASPLLDGPDRERWWKDTEKVRPLRTRATTRTLKGDFSLDEGGSASRTFAARAEGIRTNPATPAGEKPGMDFLFNPNENEEQFMKKTMTKVKGSIRRRNGNE
ncbi:uncharacterized protein EKO05_0005818 [Ascochyta rabiei]|uniref:Uncharacterized protein n=1 Tax=Didymella rabiei TaxID=5454 RepID=A0A163LVA3_DIDRA|nr:uncharacterized protein EKO05_0005818 [Ascochyta rabiei]KZM28154.1 hypothetical protein ST47_g716 [Ascochyta rabiei]UPX15371.1 hypothetical protein EKO05_0005818 [Ascochyta rabiei]